MGSITPQADADAIRATFSVNFREFPVLIYCWPNLLHPTIRFKHMSGTYGGFNVEVDKGTFATGGSSSVKVNGKSITHSNAVNRAWSFDWTAPSAGSGMVNVDIAGMTANGAYGNNGDAWSTMSLTITETVVVTNNPPSVSNVQITPSMATSLDDLTLAYTYSDQDGDLEGVHPFIGSRTRSSNAV